jgi:hypothetical protein
LILAPSVGNSLSRSEPTAGGFADEPTDVLYESGEKRGRGKWEVREANGKEKRG